MGLWMCHMFRAEDWARRLGEESMQRVGGVLDALHGEGSRQEAGV